MNLRERLHRNRYTIATIIVMIVVYLMFPLQFETHDDPQIMNYISGLYSGEPGAMPFYMQVPYSFLIAMLYRITTQISWYSIAFLVINAAAIVAISRVMVRENDAAIKYLAFLGVVEALYLCNLVNVQYTTVSGFAGAAAVALIYSIDSKANLAEIKWQILSAAIFIFLGYNIRNQSISVLVVVIGCIVFGNKVILRNSIRNQLAACLVCLGVVALSYGCNTLYTSGTEWEDYAALQVARGGYMDYERPPYEEAVEAYEAIGWDASATEIIRNWCFRLDEANTEDFAELNTLIRAETVRDKIVAFGSNILTYMTNQRREVVFMGIELLWLLCLWIPALMKRDEQRLRTCIYLTGLWILQAAFIGYLVWGGRYKERAMYMTFFICSTPIFKELLDAMFDRQEQRAIVQYLPIILLGMLVYMGYTRVSWRTLWSYESIDEAEAYVREHPENIYMGDIALAHEQRMFRSFNEDTLLTNLFWWGSWLEGSGFDHDQLRLNGFVQLDLQDMLQDGYYYIGENSETNTTDLLDDYYSARYNNVTCEVVYQTENIIVYNYSLAE